MHVGHISTFSPTPCGIATYTEALIDNIAGVAHSKFRLLYHCDNPTPGVCGEIRIEDKSAYSLAAATINKSDIDLVSLQHEFAIFGGRDGEYVVGLATEISKPIVTTLHTTPTLLNNEQRRILRALNDSSAAVVVLTETAKSNVADVVGSDEKLVVVRHGIPDVAFRRPNEIALRKHWDRKYVFISAGHVSDRKGYTNTFAALSELRAYTSDFLYVVVGTYQRQFGPSAQCITSLKRMASELGLDNHILFREEYVEFDVLLEHILASDIGIVAYNDCQQSSSGMVPLILGCGRPVIATPFEYAQGTSTIVPGLHVCSGYQSKDILEVLRRIISSSDGVLSSMPSIYGAMRKWIWANGAAAYKKLFDNAVLGSA